jgi:hypothetical protein
MKMRKNNKLAITAVVVLGLLLAIFLLGGGTNRDRFLAALGLEKNPPGLVSWYVFENATAINLASEAIDTLQTIRNTNWYRYPDDKDHCWLMLPQSGDTDTCDAPHLLQNGYYTLERRPGTHWNLTFIGTDENSRLNLNTGNPTINSQYQVHFTTDSQTGTDGNTVTTTLARPENSAVFFRMIKIQLVEDKTATATQATSQNDTPQQVEITSLVQWQSETGIHETSLATTLTNYQSTP